VGSGSTSDGGRFGWVVRPAGASTVLALRGELDLGVRDELDAAARVAFEADGVEVVVVDLTAVTFMDSTGLHWLVRVGGVAETSAVRLLVAVDDDQAVRQVLEIAGLDQVLTLLPGDQAG
jgi:anti-sigma B factor antagonist